MRLSNCNIPTIAIMDNDKFNLGGIYMVDNRGIGVLDSGVGGLTVAKEFRKLLPKENIIYCGDNANVPYGNKTEEEIYRLTKDMVDFLLDKEVKLIAVACNTISSILGKYFKDCKVPIVSIIEPATDYAVRNNLKDVGVIATKFTIQSGVYERLLKEKDENIEVISEYSTTLAGVIDSGNYSEEEIEDIIEVHIHNMMNKREVDDIILGCTHYPIVIDRFTKIAPDVNFINPAYEQVRYIERFMKMNDIEGNSENSTFEIYTSGSVKVYEKMLKALSIGKPNKIEVVYTAKGF